MGDFAQQSLPLADSVSLVIQRVNQTKPDAITVRDELNYPGRCLLLAHE
jgi:hypothetical protein